jgi:hypothetical protein
MFTREYDYDPEPGNDFTYDEHGNIIYGIGFIGAPRIPMRQYGLNVDDFIEEYLKIDKNIRLSFLDKPFDNYSDRIKNLIGILRHYEQDKDNKTFFNSLEMYVADNLPNFRMLYEPQLKYFWEMLDLIKNLS